MEHISILYPLCSEFRIPYRLRYNNLHLSPLRPPLVRMCGGRRSTRRTPAGTVQGPAAWPRKRIGGSMRSGLRLRLAIVPFSISLTGPASHASGDSQFHSRDEQHRSNSTGPMPSNGQQLQPQDTASFQLGNPINRGYSRELPLHRRYRHRSVGFIGSRGRIERNSRKLCLSLYKVQ